MCQNRYNIYLNKVCDQVKGPVQGQISYSIKAHVPEQISKVCVMYYTVVGWVMCMYYRIAPNFHGTKIS